MKKTLPDGAILIPDHAEKVFTGQIFDVWQWPQELFDGSTATFEMLRRPDTVQVICVKDGQLGLIRNDQPGRASRISFIGGRADEDDSWLAAAQRETLEESGMKFKTWRLIHVRQPIPKIEWFVPWYLATDLEGEQPQQLDAGEKIELIAMNFEEAKQMIFEANETVLDYAKPVFQNANSLQDLLKLPKFMGQEVER